MGIKIEVQSVTGAPRAGFKVLVLSESGQCEGITDQLGQFATTLESGVITEVIVERPISLMVNDRFWQPRTLYRNQEHRIFQPADKLTVIYA